MNPYKITIYYFVSNGISEYFIYPHICLPGAFVKFHIRLIVEYGPEYGN